RGDAVVVHLVQDVFEVHGCSLPACTAPVLARFWWGREGGSTGVHASRSVRVSATRLGTSPSLPTCRARAPSEAAQERESGLSSTTIACAGSTPASSKMRR